MTAATSPALSARQPHQSRWVCQSMLVAGSRTAFAPQRPSRGRRPGRLARYRKPASFSQVVAAYMDVVQNEALVGLAANNVEVLNVNLQATSDRFEIGDLTRHRRRPEVAIAPFAGSRRSRGLPVEPDPGSGKHIALVGDAPNDLQPPPRRFRASPALRTMRSISRVQNNPDLLAARGAAVKPPSLECPRRQRIASSAGGCKRGCRLFEFPQLVARGVAGTSPRIRTAVPSLGVCVPRFRFTRADVRPRCAGRRRRVRSVALENIVATERDVIAQVRAAYSSWRAANEIIASTQTAVEAAGAEPGRRTGRKHCRQPNDPRHPRRPAGTAAARKSSS